MNVVFFAIIAIAYGFAAFTGNMEAISASAFDAAETSVSLVIKLIGYMALFLGVMQVAQDAGLLRVVARAIRPVMVRLFPDVPPEHPAMGAMIMNISANMLGLGNAATPMGIKAMKELDKLNTSPGVATNAMVLFLAINTSGLALLPTGAASIRAAEGSADPMGIMAPTLFATAVSTVVGISMAIWLSKRRRFALPEATREVDPSEWESAESLEEIQGPRWLPKLTIWLFLIGICLLVIPTILTAFLSTQEGAMADPESLGNRLKAFSMASSHWVVPTLIMAFISYGFVAKVKVYESFVKGAREGWDTGVRIIPYVIAILVAVAMFRASGAMDAMTGSIGIFTSPMGMPPELIPQAMVRPLSGSGAGALMIENVHSYHPDSYIGYLSSVLNGSTETTFYVLAVYFGAVGVSKVRHAVLAGLSADIAGLVASVAICAALFGHLPLKIMEGGAQESAASAVQAPVSPPEEQKSTNGLGMEKLQRAASLDIQLGQAIEYERHRVQPISLQVFEDFRISGALFEPKKSVLSPAFLMAHGHYGEGKSSGEAQGPSHVLADRGYVVLALDTPGVEESDQPNRQIHFEEGAKNRDALQSANSSAMALQVHGLQAGLDYLSQREDIQWIGAGGASGGGVQAFYTALEDPRIKALVMASFVPIPRLEKEGGCPCDWVGSQADKAIVTTLGIPSLWMSETHPSAPFPLPENSRFRHIPGPHGFEKPMITEAVLFLDEQSGHSSPKALLDPIPHTPATALVSSNIGQASISDLLQAGR